jgi:hypothetical protein
VTYFGVGGVRLSTALWFGCLGGLFTLFAISNEPIFWRIGISVGMFLFLLFDTGYFHLFFLSKNRFIHIYNWMLLPLFNVVRWKDVTRVYLVSYDGDCREDLTATMMRVLGNCSPCAQTTLWPATQAITLDESLINYIVLEVHHGKCVIPLITLKYPDKVLHDVLMSVVPSTQ